MIPLTKKWRQHRKDVDTWVKVYTLKEDDWSYLAASNHWTGYHKGSIGRGFTLHVNFFENKLGNRKIKFSNTPTTINMCLYSSRSANYQSLVKPWLDRSVDIAKIPCYNEAIRKLQDQLLEE